MLSWVLPRSLMCLAYVLPFFLMTTGLGAVSQSESVVIYPEPGDLSSVEGLWQSELFTATVNDQAVFVYGTDMDWSFFNYAADSSAEIAVTFNGAIETLAVRPVSYGIETVVDGSTIRLTVPPIRHIVVQVNGRYKLLISADPLEINLPEAADDHTIYFAPGVHHVGEGYSPPGLHDGDTIYIAGGAVVEGLFNIGNVQNLTLRGRGVIAMGEWRWTNPSERSGVVIRPNCDGLNVEGLTLVKSPGWQLSVGDSDATIENVKLLGVGNWYNSDGIQTWSDNHGTVIRNSFIFARDDALNINAGTHDFLAENLVLWNDDNGASFMLGWGGAQDSDNIVVRDSVVLENSGIGVFSARWGDQTAHIIRDVRFENITIEHADTFLDMLIAPSPWNSGGEGLIEDVIFSNIQTPVVNGIILGSSDQNSFSDIQFHKITVDGRLLTQLDDLDVIMRRVNGVSLTAETNQS